ncbi:MAG TPA: hypothetical protein ENN67_08920, partial [Firmicutes bacterium]|nr:hypothetical protein [Bacillota bacterium]
MSIVYDTPLDADGGRGVFTAGNSNTRRYRIRFPMDPCPQIVYGYAVDASWNPPSPNPPTEIPDDFPMNANMPEAFNVYLTPTADTLYFDEESGIGGGVYRLQVNVHDWQGIQSGNIQAETQVLRVFAPGLFTGGLDIPFFDETPTKARYRIDLTGTAKPSKSGEHIIAVRAVSEGGPNYNQGAGPAPDGGVDSWNVIVVDIPDPDCTGDANNDWSEAFELEFGGYAEDKVCLPDDYRDFYTFTIPPGNIISGDIRLHCDAEPTKLGLYDKNHDLITESNIASGFTSIVFNPLDLNPGQYFIRVWTSNNIQVAPYLLEMVAELIEKIPSNVTDITPGNLFVKPYHVWIHDFHAYLLGAGYWVYNIDNLLDPVSVYGETIPNIWNPPKATFLYPHCYFALNISPGSNSKVINIDFTNPASPVYTDPVITTNTRVSAIQMNSSYLYVAQEGDPMPYITIFDYTSNPLDPEIVGGIVLPSKATCMNMVNPESLNPVLVIGMENGAIHTYDVTDPESTELLGAGSITVGWKALDIATRDSMIYVISTDVESSGRLYIFEQESAFFTYANISLPSGAYAIEVKGNYAYITDEDYYIRVIDITNYNAPSHINSVEIADKGLEMAISVDLLCVIPYNSSLQFLDTSNPADPQMYGYIPKINYPNNDIFFDDGYIFISDSARPSSINVIDNSDPVNPDFVYTFNPTIRTINMYKYEDLIAAGNDYSIALIDCSNPLDMNQLSVYSTLASKCDLLGIHKNAMYVVYHDSGTVKFEIVSISDPTNPNQVNMMTYSDSTARRFIFHGDYMYCRTDSGIRIYNVTVPTMPNYINTYAPASTARQIEIHDNTMYVYMSSSDTIEIVDITNPIAPMLVGSGATGTTNKHAMAVDGQFAYFTGNAPSIYATWVWPPESPSGYGSVYPDPYAGYSLYANDGILYKRTLGNGLR